MALGINLARNGLDFYGEADTGLQEEIKGRIGQTGALWEMMRVWRQVGGFPGLLPSRLSTAYKVSGWSEGGFGPWALGSEHMVSVLFSDRLCFHTQLPWAPPIMCYFATRSSPSSQYSMDTSQAIKWCLGKEIMKNGSPGQTSLGIPLF